MLIDCEWLQGHCVVMSNSLDYFIIIFTFYCHGSLHSIVVARCVATDINIVNLELGMYIYIYIYIYME